MNKSANKILKKLFPLSSKENTLYIVGGFIRDSVLNRNTSDIDIAVKGDTVRTARKFSKICGGNFVLLDNKEMIYRVIVKTGKASFSVDFSAMRGNKIEDDLLLRDFTINSMAIKLDNENISFKPKKIIDPCGGLLDIRKKTLRTTSGSIFRNDPLRLMRAFRMAATLNFKIEKSTCGLIKKNVSLISSNTSRERISTELFKILEVESSSQWFSVMHDIGLLRKIMPKTALMEISKENYYHEGGLWEHSIKTLDSIEKLANNLKIYFPAAVSRLIDHLNEMVSARANRLMLLKLSAILHDIGKPVTARKTGGKISFHGHEAAGAKISVKILEELRLSNKEIRIIEKEIKHHMRPANLSSSNMLTNKAIYRYFRDLSEEGIEVLLLSLADRYSYGCVHTFISEKKSTLEKQKIFTEMLFASYFFNKNRIIPVNILNGDDIMSIFNIREGPEIGIMLEKLKEAQSVGKVNSKKEAVEFLGNYINRKVRE